MDLRISEEEAEILKRYAEQTGRTKTDVIREFIRSLKKKLRQADE